MENRYILRAFLVPFGLFLKLFELALEGARDLQNRNRFRGAIIGKCCKIDDKSFVEENTRVFENTFILNSNIRKFSYIGRNSLVQNATIGAYCSIANDVIIGLGMHPQTLFSGSPIFYRRKNPLNVRLVDVDLEFDEYLPIKIGTMFGSELVLLLWMELLLATEQSLQQIRS